MNIAIVNSYIMYKHGCQKDHPQTSHSDQFLCKCNKNNYFWTGDEFIPPTAPGNSSSSIGYEMYRQHKGKLLRILGDFFLKIRRNKEINKINLWRVGRDFAQVQF